MSTLASCLSGSYPYHLRFVSIHLQSVAAHSGFDPLRAADKPSDSRSYVRSSSADMDLHVIGIRVRLHIFVLDDVQQLCRVGQEQ